LIRHGDADSVQILPQMFRQNRSTSLRHSFLKAGGRLPYSKEHGLIFQIAFPQGGTAIVIRRRRLQGGVEISEVQYVHKEVAQFKNVALQFFIITQERRELKYFM
jgi:hypothetical protein